MSQRSESASPTAEHLSALVDGELDSTAVQRACAAWRSDPSVRSTWHAYHLIGDVLRSEDLASTAQRDMAFLATLQQRLAAEPTPLAPAGLPPEPAASKRRRYWATSLAVAAGFVAVVGVAVVIPVSNPEAGGELAQAPLAGPVAAPVMVTQVLPAPQIDQSEPQEVILNGQLIRDARLDQYLAAHKKFGGSSAPGVPSGFLRNAAADGTTR